jgi:hypothetical protein
MSRDYLEFLIYYVYSLALFVPLQHNVTKNKTLQIPDKYQKKKINLVLN